MLCPKLVLLLTQILQSPRVLKKHDVFYTSAIPEVSWYESLYNTYYADKNVFTVWENSGTNQTMFHVRNSSVHQELQEISR